MKNCYVCDLAVGEKITETFVVRRKQLKQTRRGDNYLDLLLADRSGEIDTKVWPGSGAIGAEFERGDYVEVTATVDEYEGKKQLVVERLRKLDPGEIDLHDFVPASPRDIDGMLVRLKEVAESVSNPYLRALADAFFSDADLVGEFKSAPGAAKMHHAYIGGLLEHTLSVVGLAELVCRHYPDIDRDLLVSSALLHDIGKVKELSWDGADFDYTVRGRFLGHTVLGMEMVSRLIEKIEGFPEQLRLELLHIIASHHGEAQFGAPREPVTKEALILHYLDNMDAKLQMAGSAIEGAEGELWSNYSKGLRRMMYRLGKEGYRFRWPDVPGPDVAGEERVLGNRANSDSEEGQSTGLKDHPFLTLFDEVKKK